MVVPKLGNWRPVDTDAHVHDAYEYKYMLMIIITMTHIYNNIYILEA